MPLSHLELDSGADQKRTGSATLCSIYPPLPYPTSATSMSAPTQCFGSGSGFRGLGDLDPDPWANKKSKMLYYHKIILLFTTLYISIDFF